MKARRDLDFDAAGGGAVHRLTILTVQPASSTDLITRRQRQFNVGKPHNKVTIAGTVGSARCRKPRSQRARRPRPDCVRRPRRLQAATAIAGAPGAAVKAPAAKAGRDLRLDLFRGLALWLIFLDHVPNNILAWFTIRNYGFSDATEIFIFISGYTAAFVYGRAMVQRGFIIAGARILKRAWQIYVAHVFLFAIFIAEISYVASSFENPLYAEEMNALDFLKQPEVTIIQALLLKFKPVNMDVLPLYIVLLLLFPVALWLLIRNATVALRPVGRALRR